jgi:S1-C subfamily serine protease
MTSWMTPSPEDNEFGSPLPPPQAPAAHGDSHKPRRRTLGVLLTLIIGFIGGLVGTQVSNNWDLSFGSGTSVQSSNSPLVTSEVGPNDASVGDTIIAQVANAMADSVVTISSSINDGINSGEATGTGVVLTADGEILTNAHVVADATEVHVRFAGETEPRLAKVLASDPGNDLALLKIDATDLKPATFAQPGTIRIGDHVGNRFRFEANDHHRVRRLEWPDSN